METPLEAGLGKVFVDKNLMFDSPQIPMHPHD